MSAILRSERVARVLADLRRQAEIEDPPAKARMRAHERELGHRVYGHERAAVYGPAASLAVAPEVGELLYVLAVARRAQTIVEFGASLGFSTIHLAAAVREVGAGTVISTEMEPAKARAAEQNLAAAGLADVVDLRVGDALETLRDVADVDLLFLDGWNNLYLDVLDLLEPALAPGALVVADLSQDDPEQVPYCERMHAPQGGYVTVEVPLDAGVVVSVRSAGSAARGGERDDQRVRDREHSGESRRRGADRDPVDGGAVTTDQPRGQERVRPGRVIADGVGHLGAAGPGDPPRARPRCAGTETTIR